jgi:CheY-like chemotaxis protein
MNEQPLPKNHRLLVIDDNQAIHADFRKILQPGNESSARLDAAGAELFGETRRITRSASFEMDSALSGEEGLARVQAALAAGRPYALAFVDVRMAWKPPIGLASPIRTSNSSSAPPIQITLGMK